MRSKSLNIIVQTYVTFFEVKIRRFIPPALQKRGNSDEGRQQKRCRPYTFYHANISLHIRMAHSLIVRQDADRAEGQNVLHRAVFIRKLRLCIHDIADYLAVQLNDKIQLRDEILMPAHDMHQVVLHTARHIYYKRPAL